MADEIPASIEPEATYTVRLARPVKLCRLPLNAGRATHEMPGATLSQIIADYGADAIRSATKL